MSFLLTVTFLSPPLIYFLYCFVIVRGLPTFKKQGQHSVFKSGPAVRDCLDIPNTIIDQ